MAERSFSALKWNYMGALVRVLSQLVIGIVLARLLGPEPFGLVAIAWVVVGFGGLIADLGFGSALVQRKDIHERDVRFVFTLLVGMGTLLFLGVVATAPLIAAFFRRPDAVPVLRALAVLFIFQAMSQVPASLLRRALNFRAIQTAQVFSYLAGFLGLGVPLAYLDFGVWSLVGAAVAQSVLNLALLYRASPHALRPCFSAQQAGFFRFGSNVTLSNLANFTISNTDTAVVGRAFGASDLGLYNRALQLVNTPMNAFMSNLQAVLFPAYARAQGDVEGLRRCYLASVGVIGLLLLPPYLVLAAVPETVVLGLYGEKWRAAVPLLVPLAIAMPLNGLLAATGPLSMGTGRVERELYRQALIAVIMILALCLASLYSLLALSWTLVLVFLLRFILVAGVALYLVQARWTELWQALRLGILLALGCAAVVRLLDALATAHAVPPVARLALAGLCGGAGWAAGAFLLRRQILGGSIGWLLGKLQGRLPGFLKPMLAVPGAVP